MAYILFGLAFFVAMATLAHATEVSRYRITGNSAEASFDTVNGCNDDLLGVSVNENILRENPGESTSTFEVSVFGNFVENCEFGTVTSFFGTAPLNPGEYLQHGVDHAMLTKTFTVNGFEIHLALTWTGAGEISLSRSPLNTEEGSTIVRGHESKSQRNAIVSGSFVVNGLDHISGNSVANGSLYTIQNNTIHIVR